MPILHHERNVSRAFDLNNRTISVDVEWFVGGTMDENDVYQTVLAATPPVFDNLVREGIRANPQGGGLWYPTIAYRNIPLQQGLPTDGTPAGGGTTLPHQGPASDGEYLHSGYSFDTTGGNEHITQSIRTVERKSSPNNTTLDKTRQQAFDDLGILDNERAIGSSGNGVGGADIIVPTLRWTVEIARPNVTTAYLRTLEELTGKVNDQTFFWRADGDVLFRGATGRGTNGRWMVSYTFEVRQTQTNVQVGNGITLEMVKGWELITTEYELKTVGGRNLHVPKTVRIEQVYETADFSRLEIGT